MRKYSKNFERDYALYTKLVSEGCFTFTGSTDKEILAKVTETPNGLTAKEAFFVLDSTGQPVETSELLILKNILVGKASINLHIKIWKEMIQKHLLTIEELKIDYPWMEEWVWKAATKKT